MRWIERICPLVVAIHITSLPTSALAANVLTRTCMTISTNFDANMPDDFVTDPDGPYVAGGILLSSIVRSDNTVILAGGTFLPSSGPEAGCYTRLLDDTFSYTYTYKSLFWVNDNHVQSMWPGQVADQVTIGVYPAISDDETYAIAASNVWNTAVAATRAVRRSAAGLSSHVFKFVAEACPGLPNASCFTPTDTTIHINPTMVTNKHVIAHEMGHALTWYIAGFPPSSGLSYDLTTTDTECPGSVGGWDLGDVEFQSAAIVEGLASYYSAIAFNDFTSGTTSCARMDSSSSNGVMFDNFCWESLNLPYGSCNATMEFLHPSAYHCDSIGNHDEDNDKDYMAERCAVLVGTGIKNAATPLDWERTFWDMTTKPYMGGTLSPKKIFEIVNDSNPVSWSISPTSGPGDPGHPPSELLDAAVANGVGAQFGYHTIAQGVLR